MATDATGTPTTLGIPTYNTAGDPPTGKGLNAIMQVIDSLIGARAPIASPVFTGNPTAPTPASSDSDTTVATTAFVQAVVASISQTLIPSGTMVQTAAAAAPSGWLLADGAAVSRTTYAALFAAIGTTHGAGDGSTTFNVPDARGRVPVGKNAATFAALGAKGGEETHVLSVTEMPSHTHSLPERENGTGTNAFPFSDGVSSHSLASGSAGGDTAHNNLQPYIVLNHIIKT